MDYLKFAMDEARRLSNEELVPPAENLMLRLHEARMLCQRRERYYRRIDVALKDFNGIELKNGRKMIVESSGSAAIFPCIRIMEEVNFGGLFVDQSDYRPLVELFIEITDDGDLSRVQCRAECLWLDPTIRLTSCDPDCLLRNLVTQLASLLKVNELLELDE